METGQPSNGQRRSTAPSNAATLVIRGRAHAARGELEEAELCYRQAAAEGDEEAPGLLLDLIEAEIVEAQEEASRAVAPSAEDPAPPRPQAPASPRPDLALPPVALWPDRPAPAARARWRRRAMAIVLDSLIAAALIIVWTVVVAIVFAATGALDSETGWPESGTASEVAFWTALGVGSVIGSLLPFAFIVRAGDHNGQSLGKQAVGIRVVRVDGRPVGWSTFWSRELLFRYLLISMIGGVILLPAILNYLWPLWDGEDRTWHDMLARTRVYPSGS